MSISNHSVDRRASTADLEGLLKSFEDSLEALNLDEEGDTAEWLESGIELIEDELAERELEASLPAHDDTYSLQDRGIEMGSYAS